MSTVAGTETWNPLIQHAGFPLLQTQLFDMRDAVKKMGKGN